MTALLRCRLRLDAASPFGTPLTSGTLFGHLAWALRERDGEAALVSFLEGLPRAPFVLSDVFPADLLPRPLLPQPPGEAPQNLNADTLKRLEEAKAAKRRGFVPLAVWKDLRLGLTPQRLAHGLAASGPATRVARAPHNVIDRRNGQTLEQAGLWFADEAWPTVTACDLYVRGPLPQRDLEDLLRRVGEQGYGRDASTGRGRFALDGIEPAGWLDDMGRNVGGAARMMSLSQGVLTPNMLAPRYRHTVLFGKVGRTMLAEVARPWKLPLLLTQAGATFAPADDGPFGAWLTGVHQDDARIGQNAFHLGIPYTEAAAP